MLNAKEIAQFRAQLLKEMEGLVAEDEGSAEDRSTVVLDQQSVGRLSRMDAMQRQAMAQATARRRQGRAARIKAAIGRIDDGEFGYCIDCGEEIPSRRLSLDPTLPTCVSCANG